MESLSSLAFRVAQRFMYSDDRYRPPRQILMGVDDGLLDPKVLLIWKYTVERLGNKFNYGAGTAYWKNKCKKEGLDIPQQFQQAGQGATFGHFKIKSADEIEEWVKETMRTAGLISDVAKTAEEWKIEISHFQSALDDAKDRISKHEKGLAEGNRVNQRTKWLAEAKKDLENASKELDTANKAIEGLEEAIEQHEDKGAPVISFEKQFQAALHEAANDLSRKEVLAQAQAALAKFEAEMSSPKFANEKQAGVLDSFWGGLQRLWASVTRAFKAIGDWADDLLSSTKTLDKLIAQVS